MYNKKKNIYIYHYVYHIQISPRSPMIITENFTKAAPPESWPSA